MTRPARIRCSTCGLDSDARTSREAILCFALSACGRGTLTSPTHIFRTNVWTCKKCDSRLDGPIQQRSRWALLDRIAVTVRHLLQVWVAPPADVKRNLFGEEERTVVR